MKAVQHFLAAAHLELVLAGDYDQVGEPRLARRSRLSAASCFWKAGKQHDAEAVFRYLTHSDPGSVAEVHEVRADLQNAGLQ